MNYRKTKIFLFALAISLILPAAVMAEEQPKKLTVSGNGTIKAAPDIAYLNVGIRTSDKDAETASSKNIEITNVIVEELKHSGIDEKDMKTQYYYVNPMYDYAPDKGNNSVTGYEVSNSLNVTIRNIEEVGKIIDTCISAGANMVNGLSYSVETPSSYYGRLFDRAVADANRKSAAIAKALGVKLSPPVSVSEGGYVNAVPSYVNMNTDMRVGSAAASVATYAAPGDIDLYANVVITYEYE